LVTSSCQSLCIQADDDEDDHKSEEEDEEENKVEFVTQRRSPFP